LTAGFTVVPRPPRRVPLARIVALFHLLPVQARRSVPVRQHRGTTANSHWKPAFGRFDPINRACSWVPGRQKRCRGAAAGPAGRRKSPDCAL